MKHTELAFLAILKAALLGEKITDLKDLSQEQWQEIFTMAEAHKVLPMVYQTVYEVPGLADAQGIRAAVRKQVLIQARKTDEFLTLNSKLKESGCHPLVV